MGRLAECSDCGAVFARDGAVDAQEPVSRCKACAARAAGQPAPAAPPARPAVQIHQNFGAMNPIEIDRKLWRGAAASGWSAVHAAIEVEGEHRSVWRYISPDGLVYQSRLEASADATLGEAGNELRAQLHEFAQQEAEGARGEAEAEEGGGGAARKRGKEEGGSKEEGGGEEGEGPCKRPCGIGEYWDGPGWAKPKAIIEVRFTDPSLRGAWWEAQIFECEAQSVCVHVPALCMADVGPGEPILTWVHLEIAVY